MNLPTNWALDPLFADKLAKFAKDTLLYGKNALLLKHIFPPGEGLKAPLPHCSYCPE